MCKLIVNVGWHRNCKILIISVNSFRIKVSSFISVFIYLILLSQPTSFHYLIGRQFYFLALLVINSKEATVLLSFVFKNSQEQHCLLRNTIIKCGVRSTLSLPGTRANQIAVSSFCPLFHFSARYLSFLSTISIRTARQLTN